MAVIINTLQLNLVIDIGNSRTKVCLFDGDTIVDHAVIDTCDISSLSHYIGGGNVKQAVISSVVDLSQEEKKRIKGTYPKVLFVSVSTPMPLENHYQTPSTLGIDRICAAVGANYLFPSTDVMVIDAGTAITIDYVDAGNQYLGGNISPGISMRFRALHQFTSKLPLYQLSEEFSTVGTSTQSAIVAGVQLGVLHEIDLYIRHFSASHIGSKIIITGGDAFFFEKNLKNTIFVEPFLVQKGLNRILNYNAIEI